MADGTSVVSDRWGTSDGLALARVRFRERIRALLDPHGQQRAGDGARRQWPLSFVLARLRRRLDQQPLSGNVGRDVLAGACVPNPGAAGAVPVRVRSRSSAGLRWTRGRLWHPRRQHRPLRTGLELGTIDARDAGSRHVECTSLESCRHSHGRSASMSHGTVPELPRECPEGVARPWWTDRRVFGTVSRLGWPPERRGYALAWLLTPRKEHWRDASAGSKVHE